jgi:hypothetical protein
MAFSHREDPDSFFPLRARNATPLEHKMLADTVLKKTFAQD